MRFARSIWLAVAIALISHVSTGGARAQETVSVNQEFYPLLQHGQLSGCQFAFAALRLDEEFSAGRPVYVAGLLLFYGWQDDRAGVMLRLGVGPPEPSSPLSPPERAYLVSGWETNASELANTFLSDSPGTRAFAFGLGDKTSTAIVSALVHERLEIAYGMPRTTVDARFIVEGAGSPAFSEWSACVRHLAGIGSGDGQ